MALIKSNTRVMCLAILVVMVTAFFYDHAMGKNTGLLDGADPNWTCSPIDECPVDQCVLFCRGRGFEEGESHCKVEGTSSSAVVDISHGFLLLGGCQRVVISSILKMLITNACLGEVGYGN
uniref:Uncharacterized protein n=1 Tax=Oryza brachyantha TaxID=4533 RepID=J3MW69_ORYBR